MLIMDGIAHCSSSTHFAEHEAGADSKGSLQWRCVDLRTLEEWIGFGRENTVKIDGAGVALQPGKASHVVVQPVGNLEERHEQSHPVVERHGLRAVLEIVTQWVECVRIVCLQ